MCFFFSKHKNDYIIYLKDCNYCLILDEIGEYIKNSVFNKLCAEIEAKYSSKAKIEYSSCSLERGWNIKYKKSGKSLCTIYLRESYFTVMVVVDRKEKKKSKLKRYYLTVLQNYKKFIIKPKKEMVKNG